MTLALGGCIKAPPIAYGITEDTGGHITYVLGAARRIAAHPRVSRVDIVTRLFDSPALGAAHLRPGEVLGEGLRIVRLDSGDRRYLEKGELAQDRPGFVAALLSHLADPAERPDIIHAHFADAADIARQVRDRFGIPFIYTAHSLAADKAAVAGGAAGAQLAARLAEEDRAIGAADAIIASSRDECERQLLAYPSAQAGRINRLRPGVECPVPAAADLAAARSLIAPFLRDPAHPMILAIARPVRKKNLVALVEAFAARPDLRDGANLVILAGQRASLADCGGGEAEAVLRELVDAIDRHDLHGRVAFPRRHDQAQVNALYALARDSGGVFVNPALTEPYGLTLVEAAAHGLPVVATREGGPQDILAELEHGVLVDPRSVSAIADAIAGLLNDRGRWATCSANALVGVREMTWDSYAAGFVTLAERILHPSDTAPAAAGVPARPQRMLLSDIDNTLTGCPEGARRLSRFLARHAASTRFGVATGRSLVEARRLLLEWGLPEPDVIVASVGTEIYWREGTGFRADQSFADAIARGWDADGVAVAVAGIAGLAPQPAVEQRRFKRSYYTDGAGCAAAVEAALAARGLAARVIHSHGNLLDIVPAGAGKGKAMHHVSAALGLPCDRVIAAGDSGNDADMLCCPGAVVVANHDEDLAAIARLGHVYRARRPHAAGVLEGLLWHARREAANAEAVDVAA